MAKSTSRSGSKLMPHELMKRRQDEIRNAIKADLIADCLSRHARGELLPNGKVMTASGVQAAVALLRKVVPDLSSVDQTVSGDDSRPIKITITNA